MRGAWGLLMEGMLGPGRARVLRGRKPCGMPCVWKVLWRRVHLHRQTLYKCLATGGRAKKACVLLDLCARECVCVRMAH